MIVAELIRTGDVSTFTPEQWQALNVNGDRSKYWKVIDSSGLLPKEVEQIEPVDFSKIEEKEKQEDETANETNLKVDFDLIDYKKLLDEKGISYNTRIKDPKKLKAIWEANVDK